MLSGLAQNLHFAGYFQPGEELIAVERTTGVISYEKRGEVDAAIVMEAIKRIESYEWNSLETWNINKTYCTNSAIRNAKISVQ